ncbi:CMRF35-like molecule 1, partial [Sorex fumeus]|uniref:CMRF35-like molecule 1 n=1 Tax=Sorex fumeus TaxID=62283 RepID=UPI0024AD5687
MGSWGFRERIKRDGGGSADLEGPGAVTGHVGGSLNVYCWYNVKYKKYQKMWCRGKAWASCSTLVETSGSQQVVRSDRVTIRDDQIRHRFTVTMAQLRASDTNTYWCGIQRRGSDLAVQVRVTVRPAATIEETTDAPTLSGNHLPH